MTVEERLALVLADIGCPARDEHQLLVTAVAHLDAVDLVVVDKTRLARLAASHALYRRAFGELAAAFELANTEQETDPL